MRVSGTQFFVMRDRHLLFGAPLQLVALAQSHYATLDARLGSEQRYFFGDRPHTLDAVVFGHIAEALRDVALHAILPQYKNLMR